MFYFDWKNETYSEALKFKVNDTVIITNYNNIFSKGSTKSCWGEIFIIDFVLETNPWTYKMKYLNWEKIKGSFMKKIVVEWV